MSFCDIFFASFNVKSDGMAEREVRKYQILTAVKCLKLFCGNACLRYFYVLLHLFQSWGPRPIQQGTKPPKTSPSVTEVMLIKEEKHKLLSKVLSASFLQYRHLYVYL